MDQDTTGRDLLLQALGPFMEEYELQPRWIRNLLRLEARPGGNSVPTVATFEEGFWEQFGLADAETKSEAITNIVTAIEAPYREDLQSDFTQGPFIPCSTITGVR